MAQNRKCFTCKYQKECKETGWCIVEPEHTINDMEWREYSGCDSVLDEVTYESLVLAIRQEHEINGDVVLRVAKSIIDQRLQDFWYLIRLNADQLIEEARKGR